MTKTKKWGDLSDAKASVLLRKLVVDRRHESLEQIQTAFAQLSGHRVEGYVIPQQPSAFNLRFCSSSLLGSTPLQDFKSYEKIDSKDVAVGLVALQPDGAIFLKLGEAAALMWNDAGTWVTITDEDLDGTPVH